jgi:hypothetical protein
MSRNEFTGDSRADSGRLRGVGEHEKARLAAGFVAALAGSEQDVGSPHQSKVRSVPRLDACDRKAPISVREPETRWKTRENRLLTLALVSVRW